METNLVAAERVGFQTQGPIDFDYRLDADIGDATGDRVWESPLGASRHHPGRSAVEGVATQREIGLRERRDGIQVCAVLPYLI
eukprot:3278307-Rhodomonas_salina.1